MIHCEILKKRGEFPPDLYELIADQEAFGRSVSLVVIKELASGLTRFF